jgi:hypothetical protein
MASATFDITAPQLTPRAKSETGPVFLRPGMKQERRAPAPTAN